MHNIVHISPTPLVAAPAKIAAAQRMIGHSAMSVILEDYPSKGPLAQKFTDDVLLPDPTTKPFIEQAIAEADIIHVHNDLPLAQCEWLVKLNSSAKYVYQVHSPLREGPLYLDRTVDTILPFSVFVVVGQYQPRLYPNFIAVPNIILHAPSVRLRKRGERLRLLFSPTHQRDGRWNNKGSQELDQAIESLEKIGRIEVARIDTPVHPNALMHMRRTTHVTIDEIATGGFHQVSLEGLCAGNVVINRAGYFCRALFSQFCDLEMPPFLYADGENIADVLLRLSDDPEETASRQQASYDFFRKYLSPVKMVEVFDAAYRSVN